MAEQGLMLKIGADVVEVTKSLNQVEQEIKDLSKAIKGLSGQELVNANKQLDQLSQTATALKNVGRTGFNQFGEQIGRIGTAANGAGPALFSLSQVARDLPFGFIAIQNNLPIVVDQFTQLSKTSGGIGAALKSVGASLLGPAGLAFGFGAVTAGVTALIQKYGSLSNAFDALIGGITPLTEAQKKLAEGVGDELAEITLLVGLYPQLEGRRDEQDKLLKKLNQSAPTYFKTLSSEKTTVDQLTASYDKYVKSLLGKIFIESQQERLKEVAKQYAQELVKLNDAQVKGAQQREKEGKKVENQVKLIERLGKAQQNLRGDIGVGIRVAPVQQTFDGAINQLLDNFKKQADAILSGTQSIVEKLDFGSTLEDKVIGDPKKAVDKLNQALKDLKQNALAGVQSVFKELEDASIDVSVKIKPLTKEELQGALGLTNSQSPGLDESLIEFDAFRKALDKAKQSTNGLAGGIFDALIAKNQEFTQSAVVSTEAFAQQIAKNAQQLSDVLSPVVDSFFNAIDQGKNVFQALGQTIKSFVINAIKQLAKLAVIAAGISIFSGGAISFGTAFKTVSGFGGGGVAAPSFGGLQGGGLSLQGGVALTLRGTDLIGAINGSNARIGRVG